MGNLIGHENFIQEKRLIAFLDILGFKNLYKKDREKALNFISWLRKNNSTFFLNVTPQQNGSQQISCSPDLYTRADHIIISFPLLTDYGQSGAVLNTTLLYLSKICAYALSIGILLRGCISFGEMDFDAEKNVIFGNHLFDAMECESSNVIYPRIVILPSSIDFLKHFHPNHTFIPKWHDFISQNYVDMVSAPRTTL